MKLYTINEDQLLILKNNIISDNNIINDTITAVFNQIIKEPEAPAPTNPQHFADWLNFKIGYEQQENFIVAFMDNCGHIIESEVMFKGTATSSLVGVNEIIRKCLLINARNIIVSHNHPSGNLTPSAPDIDITNRLKNACSMFDIKLLDHIVVSKGDYFSFRENRLI